MPWEAANCFRILEFQWYSECCPNFVMPGHRWKESYFSLYMRLETIKNLYFLPMDQILQMENKIDALI